MYLFSFPVGRVYKKNKFSLNSLLKSELNSIFWGGFFLQSVSSIILTNSLWVVFFLPHFRLVSWNNLSRLFYIQWSERGFPGGWSTWHLKWVFCFEFLLRASGLVLSLVNTRTSLCSLFQIDDWAPLSQILGFLCWDWLLCLVLFPNRDADLLGIENTEWKSSASASQEVRDSHMVCRVHQISDNILSKGWKSQGGDVPGQNLSKRAVFGRKPSK